MSKRINKIKDVMIAILIIYSLTACASNSMVEVYDNDSRIASSSNSYNIINVTQSIEEQKYKGSVEKFEGMETVWIYDASEDETVELTYHATVDSGKMKLVLITPDNSLVTIAEITSKTKLDDCQKYAINLKKGKNRIKVVGEKNTKFDMELSIPVGELSELGN